MNTPTPEEICAGINARAPEQPKVWAIYFGKQAKPMWVKVCLRFEAELFRDGFVNAAYDNVRLCEMEPKP